MQYEIFFYDGTKETITELTATVLHELVRKHAYPIVSIFKHVLISELSCSSLFKTERLSDDFIIQLLKEKTN